MTSFRGTDYSIRSGYREILSDMALLFPFLLSYIAAYFMLLILSAIAASETALQPVYFRFAYSLAIDIVIMMIEGFGVLWQALSIKMKGRGNYFSIDASFKEARNLFEKYIIVFISIGFVYFLLSLVPFTENVLAGIWAAFAFFSLMAAILENKDFFSMLNHSVYLLKDIYRNEEITGIFFVLAILLSGVPVISTIALLALVSFGSAVLYIAMLAHGL